jgi:antirestriction protein ArdC
MAATIINRPATIALPPARTHNVYEIVTSQIIAQLEQGVVPWRKPWKSEAPINLISGKEYRGINVFLLGMQGYGSRYWLTANQANKLGGHIRKGEKASTVTFWSIGEEKLNPQTGKVSKPFLLRYYSVFNIRQTDGIAEKLGLTKDSFDGEDGASIADLAQCEALVAAMPNPPKREQSFAAWYRPASDTLGMPAKELFSASEEYYSTLFHELTHATGHASRVGREGIEHIERFGSESYSKEELIAEMGAAMLCATTQIAPATLQNSASYLKCWIDRLKGDSRLLVSAASAAQKACDYIRGTGTESEVQS